MKKISIQILLLVFIAMNTGCGGGEGEDISPCGALNARVYNGQTCSQSKRSSVVALIPYVQSDGYLYPTGVCTAVFVTVDDLLTSAHCFTMPAIEFGKQLAGFLVYVGEQEQYVVTNISVHPQYDFTPASPYDLAIFTIDSVPSPPISPVPILVSDPIVAGETFITYGYGTNKKGHMGQLAAARMYIDAVSPAGNFAALITEVGASLCPGDSGGPAVQVSNGITALIGINSFGVDPLGADTCFESGALISGFLNLQRQDIISFITSYAPDVTLL